MIATQRVQKRSAEAFSGWAPVFSNTLLTHQRERERTRGRERARERERERENERENEREREEEREGERPELIPTRLYAPPESVSEQDLHGYLAHKKQPPPQDHHRSLSIGLL